jgi:competence protein ComEC
MTHDVRLSVKPQTSHFFSSVTTVTPVLGEIFFSLIGLIAGVMLQLQQASLSKAEIYAAGVALAAFLFLFLLLQQSPHTTPLRRALSLISTLALCMALSFSVTGLRSLFFLSSALDPALEGKNIVVIGRIEAMPASSEDALRFRFKPETATLAGLPVQLPPQIYLSWYRDFGFGLGAATTQTLGDGEKPRVLLASPSQPQDLRAGERWRMTVRLKAPHGASNPHGFDYELWLWEQSLQASGYVRAGPRDEPPQKISDSWAHPVERARQSVRDAIYAQVVDTQQAGMLVALVVGDQGAIGQQDWTVFRATGVAHLMSISGLHITMFAWLAARLLTWLWKRSALIGWRLCLWLAAPTAGALGGLGLSAMYALFSGWGVPAQRTIIMLSAVVLLRCSARQWPWPLVWLLAMALVVLFDPWALMQAGFWLSFVAVGVLFASDPDSGSVRLAHRNAQIDNTRISPFWARCWRRSFGLFYRLLMGLLSAAREQWVITLALTPLSLLLFNQVSILGLLANMLAIPWVTLLLTPLAMLGVIWPPLWDAAALAANVLALYLYWLASWSWASVSVASAPLWCAVAGVMGGLLLAMRLPWYWRILGLPLIVPVLLWQPLRPSVGHFDLLGADVGQGNALLVRTQNHSLIYDSGARFSRESDAGSRILVPLLRALGERVDLMVLSHRDSDHSGGAAAILAMQPQARLLSSIEDSHPLQTLRPTVRCQAGQHWRWDGVDFEILNPAATDYAADLKPNAMSCVLRITNGSHTALLTGDMEAAQERRLISDAQLSAKLKADFLLVPHHGSKTSSSADFLDAVGSPLALAQVGYRNRFNHPAASVIQRYDERGIFVLRSPTCGAAFWHSARPDVVLCQRQLEPRYWHHQLPFLGLPSDPFVPLKPPV